jgi:hypothetical protein
VFGTEVNAAISFWVLFLMILALPFFLERRYSFYNRAMQVPFSMAAVYLAMREQGDNDKASERSGADSRE